MLAGCGQEKETVQVQQTGPDNEVVEQTAPPTPEEPKEEEPAFANTYPLTGIGTNEEVDHRVYAVMINNHPKARPQSGLHNADIVYEVLAEGDVTRFLALYQSEQPKVVGPVRSARHYFINLSNGYDALYVSHGWSPQAKAMLEANKADYLQGLFYDGTLFKRADFRNAPHNSYITYENILKGAEKIGYSMKQEVKPLVFLKEEEVAQLSGEKANDIFVNYYNSSYSAVEFEYKDSDDKYIRFNGGEQTVDLETNTPIAVDNIFIIETTHKVLDSVGRRDIDLNSGGKGLLFQNGVVQEVQWRNVDGKILPYLDGEPVGLLPGKTWISIVPSLSDMVSFESN
ncbi:DUF3048 domain-containing protein [Bacillus sp. HMF5848]|nr:DUF3048 domain-containing protein [Bacillus sp. HMF5848]